MPDRIALIGNGGGGKSTLARALAARYGHPLVHVDAVQFLPGWEVRPSADTTRRLAEVSAGPRWIIDGWGPWESILARFRRADCVVLVDFPLWRHYWWATKRQVRAYWRERAELPPDCSERGLRHTVRLFRTMWRVHTLRRPALLDAARRCPRLEHVTSPRAWLRIARHGL